MEKNYVAKDDRWLARAYVAYKINNFEVENQFHKNTLQLQLEQSIIESYDGELR